MTGFCANCGTEKPDVLPMEHDGKSVLMCWDCREAPVREGKYSFGGERGSSHNPGKGNPGGAE